MKILQTPGPSSLNLLRLKMLPSEITTCVPLRSSVLEEVRPNKSLLKKRVALQLSRVVRIWIQMVLHLSKFVEFT